MRNLKGILVGVMLVGSLTMVGCQSTEPEAYERFEGKTLYELNLKEKQDSFELGQFDATKWLEKGNFTAKDVVVEAEKYLNVPGFIAEDYFKGILDILNFGDQDDMEVHKDFMEFWKGYEEMMNGKDQETEESKDDNKDTSKKEAKKPMSIKEAAQKATNYVRTQIGSDTDIMFEQTAQDENKLVADVINPDGELGYIEVNRYNGKITMHKQCMECAGNHFYWDCPSSQDSDQETGQCYDCGEEFPVDTMYFNGRSYHCGCNPDAY